MYLNASTDKIEIVLGGTVATNQLQWNVSYQDITSSGMTLPQSGGAGLTNNATAVDIVAAPAASTTRQVTQINVYNADTATATVTIRKDVSGTKYVLMRIALTTLDVLMWSRENGWRLMSATGGGTTYIFSTGLTNTSGTVTANLSTGVAGGQSVVGGTAASNSLTLSSTSNATKGKILFGTSAYDEVNNRLGIGTQSPAYQIETVLENAGSYASLKTYRNSDFAGGLLLFHARGTVASPTFLNTNDRVASIFFKAYDGTVNNDANAASIEVFATAGQALNNTPGYMNFSVNKGGTQLPTASLTVFATTNVLIQDGGTRTDAGFRLDVNGTARVQTSLDTPIVRGGTSASGTLTLSSTSNATKGKILFGTSAYDEVNNRLGVGTVSPAYPIEAITNVNSNSNVFVLQNQNSGSSAATGYFIANDLGISAACLVRVLSSTFTTAGTALANSAQIRTGSALTNGISIGTGTSAPVVLYTNDIERMKIFGGGNVFIGASPTDAGFRLDVNGTARFQGNVTISTKDIVTDTTTGSKIATGNTQKLGFWNAAPISQPTTAVAAATLVGGGGTTLTDTDTFDGYTLKQVVKALRNAGLLA